MTSCKLCPRQCGVDRIKVRGVCRMGERAVVARAAPHFGEEPCISGEKGSGTVFFAGCTLRCVFCQNYELSRGRAGRAVSAAELADIFRRLEDQGVHNLNLVSGTQFVPAILEALERAEAGLRLGLTPDAALSDTEEAMAALGELTGRAVTEDVTDRIFSRFCVGK